MTDSKSNRRQFVALPAPHDAVHVHAGNLYGVICVAYKGLPEDLLAAGAVDAEMLAGARTCGQGVDSFGNRYRRLLAGRGGKVEVTVRVGSIPALRRYPGFTPEWLPEAIRWVEQNPGALHISSADDGGGEIVVGTGAAFRSAGLVNAATFAKIDHWVTEVESAEGYASSKISRYLTDYFRMERVELPPEKQRTLADEAETLRSFLGLTAWKALEFDSETQSLVQRHIAAIQIVIDLEVRRHAVRSGLRMVVNNSAR